MSWSQATVQEKRVAVAHDILARLAAETYVAHKGVYIWTTNHALLSSLVRSEEQCEVCALGALLLSACRLNQEVIGPDFETDSGGADSCRSAAFIALFGERMLDSIESYFEGWSPYQHTLSDRERLTEIAQNLIDNQGLWFPPEVDEPEPAIETEDEDEPEEESEETPEDP